MGVFSTPLIHVNDFYYFSSSQTDHPGWNNFSSHFFFRLKNYSDSPFSVKGSEYDIAILDEECRKILKSPPGARAHSTQLLPGKEKWVSQGFDSHSLKPWSAELPALYSGLASLLDPQGSVTETFRMLLGLRTTKIKQGKLFLNGKNIALKPVEVDPQKLGTTAAQQEEFIKSLKRNNVNTLLVRKLDTSQVVYQISIEK